MISTAIATWCYLVGALMVHTIIDEDVKAGRVRNSVTARFLTIVWWPVVIPLAMACCGLAAIGTKRQERVKAARYAEHCGCGDVGEYEECPHHGPRHNLTD